MDIYELQDALANGPQPGQRFKHHKTGGIYVVIARSLDEPTYKDMITYQNEDTRHTWTRETGVFMEIVGGKPRFEAIQ